MKKLFPDGKEPRKGILEFLDKKGFYVVLILCIAVVATTATFVATHTINSSSQEYDLEKIIPEELDNDIVSDADNQLNAEAPIDTAAAISEATVAVNDTANAGNGAGKAVSKETGNNNEEKKDEPKQPVEKKNEENKKSSTAKPEEKTKAVKNSQQSADTKTGKVQDFIVPVFGEVNFDYAKDKLIYSKTLEEWRTHSGVDIAASRGTNVKAAGDGVVSEVKNDPRWGVTIIIDHQNGIKTVYANLASGDVVVPNQKIKQGDIIGCIGNTAVFEAAEEAHLHFEVWKNNEPVNPGAYLPEGQGEKL